MRPTTPEERRREMDETLDEIDGPKLPVPILIGIVLILAMFGCLVAVSKGAAPEMDGEQRIERVDLIEVNHYYDENGVLLLDQVIFFDWCDFTGRYQVRSWRLLKTPNQYPRPMPNGGYALTLREGRVEALKYRETWAQHDPELIERRWLPREERRELFVDHR